MTNREKKDVANIPVPPLLMFLIVLVAATAFHRLLPFSSLPGGTARVVAGVVVMLMSGVLAGVTFVKMHRERTSFDPGTPTTSVCCTGIFRLTRNPMYLSLVLLLFGIGLFISSIYFVLLAPVLLIVYDRLVVRAEEAYLTEKFGEAYLRYKARVRRWL